MPHYRFETVLLEALGTQRRAPSKAKKNGVLFVFPDLTTIAGPQRRPLGHITDDLHQRHSLH